MQKKESVMDLIIRTITIYLFIYYAELPFHSIMRLAHSLTD